MPYFFFLLICNISQVTLSCDVIIFFLFKLCFVIMANDRQRCYAIPDQQEYKTLKKKRFSGNFTEIQVAMSKEK